MDIAYEAFAPRRYCGHHGLGAAVACECSFARAEFVQHQAERELDHGVSQVFTRVTLPGQDLSWVSSSPFRAGHGTDSRQATTQPHRSQSKAKLAPRGFPSPRHCSLQKEDRPWKYREECDALVDLFPKYSGIVLPRWRILPLASEEA